MSEAKPETTLPFRKPMIMKEPGETMALYWKRAEMSGVGRECTRCGAKRRFSRLICPNCGSGEHVHCSTNPIDKSFPPEALETLADMMDIVRPQYGGPNFQYQQLDPSGELITKDQVTRPISDDADLDIETLDPTQKTSVVVPVSPPTQTQAAKTHDPDLGDSSKPKPKQSYDSMTRDELTTILSQTYGVDVPTKTSKSQIIKRLEEEEQKAAKPLVADDSDLESDDLA